MPGFRSSSYSGRPVTGSIAVKTFWSTYGWASTKRMGPAAVRSSVQRYPLRAGWTRVGITRPSRGTSISSGAETSSQSHDPL